MAQQRGLLQDEDDVVYLFLPLAHAFALLVQLGAWDTGTTIAYWGGDPKQIIPELAQVQPTYLPSVPRIFEKLYGLVTAHGDPSSSPRRRRSGSRSAGSRRPASRSRRSCRSSTRRPTSSSTRTSAPPSAAGCARP
jgi:long-subunit acyl-CoA synthetase (AMP-forming)